MEGPEVAANTMPVGGEAEADPGARTPARRPQDWEPKPARAGGRCSPRRAPRSGALPATTRGSAWGQARGSRPRPPRPRPARAPGGGLTPAGLRLWLGAAWHGPGEVAFGF